MTTNCLRTPPRNASILPYRGIIGTIILLLCFLGLLKPRIDQGPFGGGGGGYFFYKVPVRKKGTPKGNQF